LHGYTNLNMRNHPLFLPLKTPNFVIMSGLPAYARPTA